LSFTARILSAVAPRGEEPLPQPVRSTDAANAMPAAATRMPGLYAAAMRIRHLSGHRCRARAMRRIAGSSAPSVVILYVYDSIWPGLLWSDPMEDRRASLQVTYYILLHD